MIQVAIEAKLRCGREFPPLPHLFKTHTLAPLSAFRRQAVRAKYGDVRARKLAEAASVVNELLYKATVSITQVGRAGRDHTVHTILGSTLLSERGPP